MAVRIEHIHDRESQHGQSDSHRHGYHGSHAHGVFRGLLRLSPVPLRNGAGDRRNNGNGKRGHKGGREIKEGLYLAVNTEENARLMLGEAGCRQTAVTDSGVQRAQDRHDACSE